MHDRASLLRLLRGYCNNGLLQEEAVKVLCEEYKTRAIEPRPGIHSRIKQVNRASLLRWKGQVQKQGWASLAGNFVCKKKGFFDNYPEAAEILLSLLLEFPHTKGKNLYRALSHILRDKQQPLPGERATTNFLKKWKEEHAALFTSALFNSIVEQQFSIYTDDGFQVYFCRQPLCNSSSFLRFLSPSTH